MKKHIILLFVTSLILTTQAFSQRIIAEYNQSFDISAGGTLIMDVERAGIEIRTHNGNNVEISLEQRGRTLSGDDLAEFISDYQVEAFKDGDNVEINADLDGNWGSFWNRRFRRLNIKFVVKIPKNYNIDVKTSGGSIDIEQLDGEVEARTSGGSITVDGVTGDLNVRTSGGSIKLGHIGGEVQAHTAGGSIKLESAGGDVEVETSGGSIRLGNIAGNVDAHTSGGSITAHITKQPTSACTLRTSGGSITVYLAEGISMDLNAKTSAGRVHTDFPISVRGSIHRSRLQGKLNDGGPMLTLKTSAGSVNIRRN